MSQSNVTRDPQRYAFSVNGNVVSVFDYSGAHAYNSYTVLSAALRFDDHPCILTDISDLENALKKALLGHSADLAIEENEKCLYVRAIYHSGPLRVIFDLYFQRRAADERRDACISDLKKEVARLRSILERTGTILPPRLYDSAKLVLSARSPSGSAIYAPHGYLYGLEYCTRLTSLNIQSLASDDEVVAKALSQLTTLNHLAIDGLTCLDWAASLVNLTSLEILSYIGSDETANALSQLTTLNRLVIGDSMCLDWVTSLVNLTALGVDGEFFGDWNWLTQLSSLVALRLDLYGPVSVLPSLTRLTALQVCNVELGNVPAFTRLEHLRVVQCEDVPDLSPLTRLATLLLGCAPCDAKTLTLLSRLPLLKAVKLDLANAETREALASIMKQRGLSDVIPAFPV